ncbi:hypothetical protein [Flavobacterium sp.]|uniref:hypothetical protein n=1 Tax=Flavobacterium sp. TaxID=239 RepID=UPI00286E7E99|nr:hypothetical protein [Flavobacterium sp.]
MKTIAILFLSLFLSKSCQSKKEISNNSSQVTTTLEQVQELKSEPETETVKTQKQEKGTFIQYEASTRGSYLKITILNEKLTLFKDRDPEAKGDSKTLTAAEVSELATLLKEFKPELLPTLKWPTELRFYDGALHANLTIVENGNTHITKGFDHGHPPVEIEKFVIKLLAIAENK